MKLDDYRTSDNVGDQRGQGFGGGGFGGGGGIFGLLFGLVLSRFGIGGVLILALGYCALSTFGGGLGLGGTSVAPHQATQDGKAPGKGCAADPQSRFSCQVLASTEDTWTKVFTEQGQRYTPAGFDFHDGNGSTGCGAARTAMGPFYCPTDNKIYLDTSFYQELQNRFGAAGDFAQAYVIAQTPA
jgi:predicted metalloprotease